MKLSLFLLSQNTYFLCFFPSMKFSVLTINEKTFTQVARKRVKVATDGKIFSFWWRCKFFSSVSKKFLLTLQPCSRYWKGLPELVRYVGEKIGTIRHTDRIIFKKKWSPRRPENEANIGPEYSDETFILMSIFFFSKFKML